MEFIKDCLSREMSLRAVATKYGIEVDDMLERYHQERSKYSDEEIEQVMQEVYYGNK